MNIENATRLTFTRIRAWSDYLSGTTDESPDDRKVPISSPLWGVWWGVLIVIIYIFSGQSSKFIYIDF